jgi:hypothetical protein
VKIAAKFPLQKNLSNYNCNFHRNLLPGRNLGNLDLYHNLKHLERMTHFSNSDVDQAIILGGLASLSNSVTRVGETLKKVSTRGLGSCIPEGVSDKGKENGGVKKRTRVFREKQKETGGVVERQQQKEPPQLHEKQL